MRPASPTRSRWIICLVATLLGLHEAARAQTVAWSQQQVAGPSPRESHAMAYDSGRAVTVLFGGDGECGGQSCYFSDTWEWNGAAWTQRAATGPSPRFGSGVAYDSRRGVTVLYGGYGPDGLSFHPFSDTWEWNGALWTRRSVSGAEAVSRCAMAYDSARGVMVLFGGCNLGGCPTTTWEWDGVGNSWLQRATVGPSGRAGMSMVYDSRRAVTVLFGGGGINTPFETWEWNGVLWTQRTVSGISPRSPAGAFDSRRGVTVMFGGHNQAETWEWDGVIWTQRPITGPSPRISEMAFESSRGDIVLFGGFFNNAALGETWVLGPCGSADFDHDDSPGTDADIEAFFACLAGNCCPTCDSADFNGDGDTGTDADIEAFFRVLAGGAC